MSWFSSYVDELVEAWSARQRSPSLRGFREFLEKEGFCSTEIGDLGEKIVAKEFEDRGHLVVRSQGSRSPADVFAFGDFEKAGKHLILTQVKTGFLAQPAALSRQEIRELEAFAAFSIQQWMSSAHVPAEMKAQLSVVSVGHATIELKYTEKGFDVVSARYSYQGSIGRKEHSENLFGRMAAVVFFKFFEKGFRS
jgi:Holliday junction resolvase